MPRIFNDEQCGAKAIWPYPFGTTPIFLQEAKKNLERAPLFPRSFSTSCRKMGDAGAIVKLSPRPSAFGASGSKRKAFITGRHINELVET